MYSREIQDAYRHMRMNPKSQRYIDTFRMLCEKHGLNPLYVIADLRGMALGIKNRVVRR
jgi:hypothetical protein